MPEVGPGPNYLDYNATTPVDQRVASAKMLMPKRNP